MYIAVEISLTHFTVQRQSPVPHILKKLFPRPKSPMAIIALQ